MAIDFVFSASYELQGDGTSTSITFNPYFTPNAVTAAVVSGGLGGFTVSSTSINALTGAVTVNFSSAPQTGASAQFVLSVTMTTTNNQALLNVSQVLVL